jgi:hypothetical protein
MFCQAIYCIKTLFYWETYIPKRDKLTHQPRASSHCPTKGRCHRPSTNFTNRHFIKLSFFFISPRMTDLFSPLAVSTSSHSSSVVGHFFNGSSSSGRDSPRTRVAEEMFKLHIGTPPIPKEDVISFSHFSHGKVRKRSSPSPPRTPPSDRIDEMSPSKRRSRKLHSVTISPVKGVNISSSPPQESRPHSPPPPEVTPSSDDEMDVIRPADERTRYLRQKKRMEQIHIYRMRELRYDRESRIARRNNLKASKSATQSCGKRVKFAD